MNILNQQSFSDLFTRDDHSLWLSRITSVEAWQYSVPLVREIKTPKLILSQREGIVLRWQIEGCSIYSDLCPLPGFNTETLDSAFNQLKEALTDPNLDLFPSVDLAIFSARFQQEHSNINLVRECKSTDSSQICYLLSPEDDMPSQGVSNNCIKIKIGQSGITQDINRIQQVCLQLKQDQKIRLDANGLFNHDNLGFLFSQIDLKKIDYIEDPFRTVKEYKGWFDLYSVAYAWDDLADQWNPRLAPEYQPSALIIKPLFMGFRPAWVMALEAERSNVQVVFSSAYESSLNNQLYANIAHLLCLNTPQGLDTDKYWSSSLLAPPLTGRPKAKTTLKLADMKFLGDLL